MPMAASANEWINVVPSTLTPLTQACGSEAKQCYNEQAELVQGKGPYHRVDPISMGVHVNVRKCSST